MAFQVAAGVILGVVPLLLLVGGIVTFFASFGNGGDGKGLAVAMFWLGLILSVAVVATGLATPN